jgi:predicted outer membrane repeat protein
MISSRKRWTLMTLLGLAMSAASPARAAYFVHVAQRGEGSITNNRTCNLADAIDCANRQMDGHGCVSDGPDRQNIYLDNSLVNGAAPVYVLTSTQTITAAVYISAGDLPGDSIIQSSAGTHMFLVKAGASLFLSAGTWKRSGGTGRVVTNHGTFGTGDAQIQGGSFTTACDGTSATGCGGGIFNDGVLWLRAIVTGNTADLGGGVYEKGENGSYGNSTISGNTAVRNGGGIYNLGNPNLYSVTIDGNSAVDGAGVYNDVHVAGTSAMHFERCTISNNQASGKGGGIYTKHTIYIDTSTIARNSALNSSSTGNGGGIYATQGPSQNYLELYWSTVAFNRSNCHSVKNACTNGAGVFVSGSVATKSDFSLFSNNTRGSNNQPSDYFGNAHTDDPSNIGSFFSTVADTITNDSDLRDPNTRLSGTLADNGGPTLTLALPAGSPPTVTTLANCGDTDQTFSVRPVGSGCDYGAFEAR